MNAYVISLLGASLAAAVIELLSPRGEGGRTAAHVRMIAGLYVIVALLQPLRAGIELLQNAVAGDLAGQITDRIPSADTDYEATFEEHISSLGKREVESWATSVMESRFDIPPSGCRVEAVCHMTDGRLTLSELRIALGGAYAAENPHPIEAYMQEQLGCPCYVTVDL